ncbi:short-chain dehydrogenase/reductase SDR [Aspergillus steynii IBT 23096]|uniref:Short-chain dehydrogenase/reductase SDR n=1 Tax=Aspergillus steynii IBT 23096 TaxID=1392250 RepID=A0A2I2FW06_9EURO|nr:short-chain dehydrogenase/reductase SDR [Aspergillus steynii IBT 23096]PLB44829.1 short-chain dehydrogenase/reductase SDR [Aspergillus steynii IBT 23096]
MPDLLRNKVILVTGSSSGIGREIAARCAQQGASMVLHHLGTPQTEQEARSLHDEIPTPILDGRPTTHLIVGHDLTADDAPDTLIHQTVSAFGRIDVLVNNAGICEFAPAESVTKSLLTHHMDVNYTAAYLLTRAASQQMARQGSGGSVISISSITALLGSANLTHYAPSKAALLAMSKSFAVEYGARGIRYNCVLPGTIQTKMNERDLAVGGKKAFLESRVPLGRLGWPRDLAGAVMFFASDMSAYVSGQEILVDGGASINYQ